MKKLAILLFAGIFVLALSAPAFAHGGKAHGKNLSSPGHAAAAAAKAKNKGSSNAAKAGQKKTLVVVGTVQAHNVTAPSGAFDVSFAYGNAPAAKFVHDVETDGVVTFKYGCLKFLGKGSDKNAKNCTRVATAGKIKAKVAGDLKEGDLVVVVSAHEALSNAQDVPVNAKLVTIKKLGVGLEGVIHSVNTQAATLVLGAKEGNAALHRDTTVNLCQAGCTAKGKPFTLIFIGKTASDIEELGAWIASHPNARAHVRLKGGTTDAQVVRVRK